jgi:hypothetical protein
MEIKTLEFEWGDECGQEGDCFASESRDSVAYDYSALSLSPHSADDKSKEFPSLFFYFS